MIFFLVIGNLSLFARKSVTMANKSNSVYPFLKAFPKDHRPRFEPSPPHRK